MILPHYTPQDFPIHRTLNGIHYRLRPSEGDVARDTAARVSKVHPQLAAAMLEGWHSEDPRLPVGQETTPIHDAIELSFAGTPVALFEIATTWRLQGFLTALRLIQAGAIKL